MSEETTPNQMSKDIDATRWNVLSGQEMSSEIVGESASNRYMEQDTPQEHSIQSPELPITIRKSSEVIATNEADIAEDISAKVEVNVLVKDILMKDSDKCVPTKTEYKGQEFGECDIDSIREDVVLEKQPIETSMYESKLHRSAVDVKYDNVSSSDSVHKPAREVDIQQVIKQCMEDLVKTVTYCTNQVPYLVSPNTEIPKKCLSEPIQLSEPSDQLNIITHRTVPGQNAKLSSTEVQSYATNDRFVEIGNQKLKISECSPSDLLKVRQLKKALKDIEVLSSCTEEIGRMNEIFKTEVIKVLAELMIIRRSARYVSENLTVLEDLPACTILFHAKDEHPQVMVNVHEFGSNLLKDLSKLFRDLQQLLKELDEFRLKFIDLSETFSMNPFELYVGEVHNHVLDAAFSAAKQIYRVYFDNDCWEIRHARFVSEHEALINVGSEFDALITKLGAHYGEH